MLIFEKKINIKYKMYIRENCSKNLNLCIDYIKDVLIEEYPTNEINEFYLALALVKNVNVANKLLGCLTTTSLAAIEVSLIKEISARSITAVKPGRDIPFSNEFNKILDEADKEQKNRKEKELDCHDIILAFLKNNDENNKVGKILRRNGLTYSIFEEKILLKSTFIDPGHPFGDNVDKRIVIQLGPDADPQEVMEKIAQAGIGAPEGNTIKKNNKSKHPNIDTYCVNLNDLVDMGKIDRIVGRENEIDEIIRILGRRKKNNAIIVGPDGCGKTVICESLATKIKDKSVPEFLLDKEVIELDMTALVAGTTLRGMFEDRVKGVLTEIKKSGNYILFIDNIGSVLNDKGRNDYDISSMLSASLENGELQVIGTSDFKSYRSTFDKNPSLSRRFQKIIIEAPTKEESIDILNGIKGYYEDFHKVIYDKEILKSCVELAARYMPERNLPDSAIDIMDEIGAVVSISKSDEETKQLKLDVENIKKEIEEYKKEEVFSKVDELRKELKTKNNLITEKKKNVKRENYTHITEDMVLNLVSKKTNIPITNLSTDDKEKLSKINDRLKEEVIGQDQAIDTICKALKRNRIGLSSNKCLCSFLTIGKSGVGKTLIAKKLAKEMFGSEESLIRLDMSEYPDKSAVNKLIGSNPGYVGYEDGGILTEKIKNKKYCVLLLDEIEKADKDVYNVFLQILDEGRLTDNSGMKVDFSNVIVLFTSNVGAKSANDFKKGMSFNDNENKNSKKIFEKELKNTFPPEFLNRLNGIIYFNNLTENDLKKIINIELNKCVEKFNELNYEISFDNKLKVIDFLYEKIKDENDYGARPVIRIVQNEIEDKLTDIILANETANKFKISAKTYLKTLDTSVGPIVTERFFDELTIVCKN